MLVGSLPFADSNLSTLYELIAKGKYSIPDYVSEGMSI
jgi:hypothetical protein